MGKESIILQPHLQQVPVEHHDFPLAQPISIVKQTPTGPALMIIGGISPRVHVAAQILSGLTLAPGKVENPVDRALELADELLQKAAGSNGGRNNGQDEQQRERSPTE